MKEIPAEENVYCYVIKYPTIRLLYKGAGREGVTFKDDVTVYSPPRLFPSSFRNSI